MRGLIFFALIGLVAQSVADAPSPVYASPVQEYAAPAQEYAPAAQAEPYSLQTTGYEAYQPQEEEYEEVEEVEETEEHSGGLLTNFFSNMLTGAPVDAITSLLGVTGLDNVLHDNKITVVGSHGKPIVIPLPFGKHHPGKKEKAGKVGSKLIKLKKKKFYKRMIIAKILTKFVLNVVGFTLLFFVVAGVGATVCAFTPFCSITLPAAREMRSLATTANLNMLSKFVMDAVSKYQNLQ